jgi:hypothetical protein
VIPLLLPLVLPLLMAGSAALLPLPSRAGEGAAEDAKAKDATGEVRVKEVVDPQAFAALEKMGAFLRAQASLSVRGETTTDEVHPSGQKVQYGGVVELRVRRPDRMRADVSTDRQARQIFYDGKTFTVYGRDLGYYASFPAPPTLSALVHLVEQRHGLELPLSDLFSWGTDDIGIARIRRAMSLGAGTVAGVTCDHYAFHQEGIDWQIWIERGPRPLPRKLVITTLGEPAQPQHTVVLTWQLSPRLEDAMFAFVAPAASHQIAIEVVEREGWAQ